MKNKKQILTEFIAPALSKKEKEKMEREHKERCRKREAELVSKIILEESQAIHEYEEHLNEYEISDGLQELIEIALEEEKEHLKMFGVWLEGLDGISAETEGIKRAKELLADKNEKGEGKEDE